MKIYFHKIILHFLVKFYPKLFGRYLREYFEVSRKYRNIENEITVRCSKSLYPKLINILKIIKLLGQMGCSRRLVLLDADIKKDKTNTEWFIDGDGSDKIKEIK